jgi:hypothetical protein
MIEYPEIKAHYRSAEEKIQKETIYERNKKVLLDISDASSITNPPRIGQAAITSPITFCFASRRAEFAWNQT